MTIKCYFFTMILIVTPLVFSTAVWPGALAVADPWYVDDDNQSNSRDGKSWMTAWQDASEIDWDIINPGDTIFFADGNFSPLTIGKSGLSEMPITIRAAQDEGYTGQAVFDGNNAVSLIMGGVDNITIDGEFNGSRNFRFTNSDDVKKGACIESTSTRADHWTLRYIEVDNCGIGLLDAYTQGLEVEYSYFHDIRGDAALSFTCWDSCSQSDSWGVNRIHHNVIQVNHAASNTGEGPDGIQAGTGVDFYNNVIYGDVGTVWASQDQKFQHQDLIQAQNRYWRIYNNSFRNSADSCIDFDLFTPGITRWEHVWIYNNTFENSLPFAEWNYPQTIRAYSTGGSPITAINDILIANNTFTDLLFTHIRIYFSHPTITNTAVKNNILFNTGNGPYSCIYLAYSENATASDWNFDYNLIDAGPSGIGYVAIDNDCSDSASCTETDRYTQDNDLTGTPAFVSYTQKDPNNDLRLSNEDTAVKNLGVDLGDYFTTDKDNIARTGAWDAGAYEAGQDAAISAPQNLRFVNQR